MIKSSITPQEIELLKKNPELIEEYIYTNLLIKKEKTKTAPLSLILNPKKINKQKFQQMQKEVTEFHSFLNFCFNNIKKILLYFSENIKHDLLSKIFLNIILEAQKKKIPNKPISLISRYDYMYDQKKQKFMQIEFNITAVSLGYHNSNVTRIIPCLYNNLFKTQKNIYENNYSVFKKDLLLKTFNLYENNQNAYIAILNSNEEVNIFETRQIERFLVDNKKKVLMLTMNDIKKENFWVDEKKNFFFKGKEIGMFYFRSLYNYTDFEKKDIFDFYVESESSNCINIPSAISVLISLKPIQHLIFSDKLLKKYKLEKIKEFNFSKFLTPTYLLKIDFDDCKKKMIHFILTNGGVEKYLFKSFDEGGESEIIGSKDIISFIENNNKNFINNFILVYKIDSPKYESVLFKNGKVEVYDESISEFGFFAGNIFKRKNYVEKNNKDKLIIKDKDVLKNENNLDNLKYLKNFKEDLKDQIEENFENQYDYEVYFKNDGPWIMRTKEISQLKGGVAVNASSLDCFELVDEKNEIFLDKKI